MKSFAWGQPVEEKPGEFHNPFASLLPLEPAIIETPLEVPLLRTQKDSQKPLIVQEIKSSQPKIRSTKKNKKIPLATKKKPKYEQRKVAHLQHPRILTKPDKIKPLELNPLFLPSLPKKVAFQHQSHLMKLNHNYGKKQDQQLNLHQISKKPKNQQMIKKPMPSIRRPHNQDAQVSTKRKIAKISAFPKFTRAQVQNFHSNLLKFNRSFQNKENILIENKLVGATIKPTFKRGGLQVPSNNKKKVQQMILTGVVTTLNEKFAIMRVGGENYIISEGGYILKKQVFEIHKDRIILLEGKKWETLRIDKDN